MTTRRISPIRASAVILAGGVSSRMGSDKADIQFNGRTLLQIAHDELASYFDQVIISIQSGKDKKYLLPESNVVFVDDKIAGRGPLGGIYSVMNSVKSELYFVVACDMPFASGRLATEMISTAGENYDVVIPRTSDNYLHPLHAIYRRTCLPHIHAQLLGGKNNKIIGFFDKVRVSFCTEDFVRVYDPNMQCLDNINTRSDLKRILAR